MTKQQIGEKSSFDRSSDSGEISSEMNAVSSDTGVIVTQVRRGNLHQAPFIFLGSEAAWLPVQEEICKQLDSSIPVIRVALTLACQARTAHGVATHLLNAIQSRHSSVSPLCVLAHASTARVAQTLAIRCLMLDLPVGFVGVIDPTYSDGDCLEDELLRKIAEDPMNEACLAEYFDVHWFYPVDSQFGKPSLKRLRSSILKSSSLEDLAKSITATVQTALIEPTAIDAHEPLLTIQFGRQVNAPYFCLAGAGAGVTDFVAFSIAIDDSTPVYGLQSRGLYDGQIPFGSVESAARHHMDAICASYPTGPLHLVGHSFGGWVAFEIATKLQESGREVRSLTLLDSEVPGQSEIIGKDHTWPEAILHFGGILEQTAGQDLGIDLDSIAGLSCEDCLVLLHRKMVDARLLPKASSPDHLRGPVNSFIAALRSRYIPVTRFKGLSLLVMACRPLETPYENMQRHEAMALGWRSLAPHLETYSTAGNHISLLREQHIGEVIRRLRDKPAGSGGNE